MVRPCPPTLALPSAFVSGVKWAGKIPNISLESSSQTAGTITEKAAAPGTEASETHHTCVLSLAAAPFVGASFSTEQFPQLSLVTRDGDAGNQGPLCARDGRSDRRDRRRSPWLGCPVCVQRYFCHHGEADSFAAPQESQPQLGDCLILMTRR